MGRGCRVSNIAGHLLTFYLVGKEGEWSWICVTVLRFKARPIDASAVQPRRSSGLESLPIKIQASELIAQ